MNKPQMYQLVQFNACLDIYIDVVISEEVLKKFMEKKGIERLDFECLNDSEIAYIEIGEDIYNIYQLKRDD